MPGLSFHAFGRRTLPSATAIASASWLVLLAAAATAQTWVQPRPAASPSARTADALAYDAARQRSILFGGDANGVVVADTWEWDGAIWTLRTPAQCPPARHAQAMVYDAARGKVVLFGGGSGGRPLGDTWEWDGTNWSSPTPAVAPPPRGSPGMAYDPTRQRVVLFGGFNSRVSLSDTWEWDGTTWNQGTPTVTPPARHVPRMAYDPLSRRILMFGGIDAGTCLADTWEWDGANWTQRVIGSAPSARHAHAMALDALRQRIILVGGWGSSGKLDDTWEWDGAGWSQLQPAPRPSPRSGHAMAYHGNRIVLFGGHDGAYRDDTWELVAPSYTSIGSGCRGTWSPRLLTKEAPRLGRLLEVVLQTNNLGVTGGLFLLGLSEAAVDLGSIGAPGCTLYVVDWTSLRPFAGAGPAFPVLTTSIPNDPNLLGFQFFNQAFCFDPAANTLGIVATNGGRGIIG